VSIPLIQQYRVARYILSQRLRRNRRYPLVLMLEPLFQCNLACAGCGKIDYEENILRKRLSVEEALGADVGHHEVVQVLVVDEQDLAGLALLGDLTHPIADQRQIVLGHRLETVTLLPPERFVFSARMRSATSSIDRSSWARRS